MNEYVPTSLRESTIIERKEERWGVGIEHNPGEFGMSHGPFLTENEALESIGIRKSRIIHFRLDGLSEVIWYWRKDRWIKHKNKKR